MKREDLLNWCYSCLIDGGGEHEPITLDDAAYTLECWRTEDADVRKALEGVTPEAFMMAWNDVYYELHANAAAPAVDKPAGRMI